jgi:hypothetical protein
MFSRNLASNKKCSDEGLTTDNPDLNREVAAPNCIVEWPCPLSTEKK